MIQFCNSNRTYLKQHSLDFYSLGEKSRYDPWGNYLNLVMRKCNTLWLLYNNVEAGMKWKLNENHWSAFIQKIKMKTTHACVHVCGVLTKSLAVFQIQVWKNGFFPLLHFKESQCIRISQETSQEYPLKESQSTRISHHIQWGTVLLIFLFLTFESHL